ALMHRAFGIDVLACAQCGGRLRLIATLHDPAVIRKILAHLALAHSGQSPGAAPPESGAAAPRSDRLRGPADAIVPAPRGGIRADSAGVRRPIDGGGLSGLACRSPGPACSTREEAADVHCGSGFWGGQRPSLAHYVTVMGPMDGATAAGGRSCCLSSQMAPSPLAQFQGVDADEAGTIKLLRSLNHCSPNPMPADRLDRVFARWWPDLKNRLDRLPLEPTREFIHVCGHLSRR